MPTGGLQSLNPSTAGFGQRFSVQLTVTKGAIISPSLKKPSTSSLAVLKTGYPAGQVVLVIGGY